MKNLIITIFVSSATLLLGLYIGAKYIGQGEVIATLCVMGDVSVKEKYLSQKQFLELSESTGRKIKGDYPILAENIALSDAAVNRASKYSDCSQILVALTKGIQ